MIISQNSIIKKLSYKLSPIDVLSKRYRGALSWLESTRFRHFVRGKKHIIWDILSADCLFVKYDVCGTSLHFEKHLQHGRKSKRNSIRETFGLNARVETILLSFALNWVRKSERRQCTIQDACGLALPHLHNSMLVILVHDYELCIRG